MDCCIGICSDDRGLHQVVQTLPNVHTRSEEHSGKSGLQNVKTKYQIRVNFKNSNFVIKKIGGDITSN